MPFWRPYKYDMTKRHFTRLVQNAKADVLQIFVDQLRKEKIKYGVIGGLAVNAYAEPVVSLDLDLVVEAGRIQDILKTLPPGSKIKKFSNSLNISFAESDLRIQIQTDSRYQAFLSGVRRRNVLGYTMSVARIEDVFQGKLWAALDKTRRPSKRQKDLADILRLLEKRKTLGRLIPEELKARLSL